MAQITVMATTCSIGKFVEGKIAPNMNLIHTPPPTTSLPKFFGEGTNNGKITK